MRIGFGVLAGRVWVITFMRKRSPTVGDECKHDWAYVDGEDFTGRFCFKCHKSEKAESSPREGGVK